MNYILIVGQELILKIIKNKSINMLQVNN